MTRKPWPGNKPLPRFASKEEELAFWERYDVPWDDEAHWEEVPGPVVAIRGTKPKAIRVVLPPRQEARLGRIARERRVSKERCSKRSLGRRSRREFERRAASVQRTPRRGIRHDSRVWSPSTTCETITASRTTTRC